jgi:serine phosphatase RsbU (regulator of sigma subunit)
MLGILLADASGHGLPAALQARDVVVGMRMGQAHNEKISRTVERLNRVIHQGGLASRFISLFYAELEDTGNLTYVNAGHCPPRCWRSRPPARSSSCRPAGPVLGPLPDAVYRRRYMPCGRARCWCCSPTASPSAWTRRARAARTTFTSSGATGWPGCWPRGRTEPAGDIAEAVIADVRAFGRDAPLADDVSVVVIRRLPAAAYPPAGGLASVAAGTSR